MRYKSRNIIICGGHLSPALALIETLARVHKYNLIFIGRKYSFEGDSSLSLEYQTVTSLKIPFFTITSGRFQRALTIHTFFSFLKIPLGMMQSFILLKKIKPVAVVSFGGYVALSVCLIAKLMNIPIITHEQTPVLGLSNRIISRISKVLCLSYKKTKYLPKGKKIVFTGNPIRTSILINKKNSSITNFGNTDKPLLFITGGSTGSKSINSVIVEIISKLLGDFRVIHQCGSADGSSDFRKLTEIKETLPEEIRKNYKIYTHINPEEMGRIYSDSTIIIGRAGANTVMEVSLSKKPSILIPLPWSADDEQIKNAQILEGLGSALIIYQHELTPDLLSSKIYYVINKNHIFKPACEKAAKTFKNNAAYIMMDIIDEILKSNNEV